MLSLFNKHKREFTKLIDLYNKTSNNITTDTGKLGQLHNQRVVLDLSKLRFAIHGMREVYVSSLDFGKHSYLFEVPPSVAGNVFRLDNLAQLYDSSYAYYDIPIADMFIRWEQEKAAFYNHIIDRYHTKEFIAKAKAVKHVHNLQEKEKSHWDSLDIEMPYTSQVYSIYSHISLPNLPIRPTLHLISDSSRRTFGVKYKELSELAYLTKQDIIIVKDK